MNGLSAAQQRAVSESTAPINIWTGAIRSGKTLSSLLRWLLYVADAPRGGELLMIGRTRDSIARNALLPLQDRDLFGPFAKHVHYTAGSATARILDRTVHVIGANDAKAEPKVRGVTGAGAYVDELTTLPEAFWTMLMGRMSVRGSKIFATTNPDSPAHWLKAKFLNRVGAADMTHWRHFHFVMDDNPSLPAEYKAQQKANYTGLWYRRFILGEWVAAEGAIYDMWDPDRHVLTHDRLPKMTSYLALGCDWGTSNPTVGILLGLGEDKRLYAVDEWWCAKPRDGAAFTPGQQSESLRAWLDEAPGRPQWTVVDPSAAAFRNQLTFDGLTTMPADNDVSYGLATVATLLGDGTLRISDRCANLIREIPGYSWDPKATEKGEDKPVKVDDHACDALRYAVVTTESVWRPQITTDLEEAA